MNLQLYISHFSESGIWLGKILANDVPFAKFAKVSPARILRYMVVCFKKIEISRIFKDLEIFQDFRDFSRF